MRVRLGVNTCFAVKRWPRPADWAPVVRDRLGLALVQHSLDLVDLDGSDGAVAEQAHAVREAVSAHGLRLHSTFTGLAAYSRNLLLSPDERERRAAEAWFERAIAFTTAVGGLGTGGHVGALSVAEWRDERARSARWAGMQAALGRLTARARASGHAWFLVENLAAAREPSTMAMIVGLVTGGDALHVPVRPCLDVGHMCVVGTSGEERDPYTWLGRLGPVAPVIQLQQSDAAGDHHWPFTPATERIGRIEPEAVLRALVEGGTEATDLILEIIPPFEQDDDDVLDDMVASVERWREAMERVGLEEAAIA